MSRFFILFVFLCAQNFTWANELQWSSFGTLAITLSDSDQYGFRRDVRSDNGVYSGDVDIKEFSLIGGQLEFKLSEQVDAVGQVVLRDISEPEWDDYISMAFLRYAPSSSWSFRIGRLSPDLFTITEYRNINNAYTYANVPTEVYGIIPYLYYDGGDISFSTRFGDGVVRAKLYAGTSDSIIAADGQFEQIALDNTVGTSVIYDKNDWNLQFRYTQGKLGDESSAINLINTQVALIPDILWPNKEAFYKKFSLDRTKASYLSVSGQKYVGNWLLSFELAQVDSDSDVISTLNSGYISSAYQYDQHTFYTVLAKTDSDFYEFNEPNVQTAYFEQLIYGIEATANYYSSNQQSLSLGWRWDITPSIASKLQVTRTKIAENGDTLWINKAFNSPAETVNSVMFTLSFAL